MTGIITLEVLKVKKQLKMNESQNWVKKLLRYCIKV